MGALSTKTLKDGTGTSFAVRVWDENAGSGPFQPVHQVAKADGTAVNPATSDSQATLNALQTGPATGTISSVNDNNADTTILASNASRKGATIFNDSTVTLYLALANVTATTSVYSVQLLAGDYYELPVVQGGVYTGIIKGIWASNASGAARVTEFT